MGSETDFVIVEDEAGRFMQTNGGALEYGEEVFGEVTLLRAGPQIEGLEDALRVFVAFAAGSDEWRRLCDWTDVTAELSEQSRPVVVILIVGAAAAAAVWFLFSVLFDAFGLAKP